MVTVDEVQSEVVVEDGGGAEASGPPGDEVRKEELRALIRELLREELQRFLRTEARR